MAEPPPPTPRVLPALVTGSRGSRVLSLTSDEPGVLRPLVYELGGGFRKGLFDLAGGFAEFMSPSQAHEFTSRDVHDVILALCHASGIDVVDMGSTSVRTPDDTAGGDPDESFLVGERATRYRAVEAAQGPEAAMASIEGQPPDTAVEVEHASRRDEKPAIYRACGVRNCGTSGRPAPAGRRSLTTCRR